MPFSLRLLHSSPKEISKAVPQTILKVRAYHLDFSTISSFCNYNAPGVWSEQQVEETPEDI